MSLKCRTLDSHWSDLGITINADVSEHNHANNFVGYLQSSGTATGGYTMHGNRHIVANNNVLTEVFRDVWKNAEGSKFQASGRFKISKDGSVVEEFNLRCVGGPTVPPNLP